MASASAKTSSSFVLGSYTRCRQNASPSSPQRAGRGTRRNGRRMKRPGFGSTARSSTGLHDHARSSWPALRAFHHGTRSTENALNGGNGKFSSRDFSRCALGVAFCYRTSARSTHRKGMKCSKPPCDGMRFHTFRRGPKKCESSVLFGREKVPTGYSRIIARAGGP